MRKINNFVSVVALLWLFTHGMGELFSIDFSVSALVSIMEHTSELSPICSFEVESVFGSEFSDFSFELWPCDGSTTADFAPGPSLKLLNLFMCKVRETFHRAIKYWWAWLLAKVDSRGSGNECEVGEEFHLSVKCFVCLLIIIWWPNRSFKPKSLPIFV